MLLSIAEAGDACCKAEAARRALVPNPLAVKPSNWDDEDDGPWEAPKIALSDLPGRYRLGHEIRLGLAGAAPWLIVGVIAAALLTTVVKPLLPSATIRSWLGGSGNNNNNNNGSAALDSMRGAVFGLMVPFCSCGALPLAVALSKEGVSPSSIAAFVTAAQAAGIDSLFFTYGVFGAWVALVRMVAAGVLAFLVGVTLAAGSASGGGSGSDPSTNTNDKGTERPSNSTSTEGQQQGSCCGADAANGACRDEPKVAGSTGPASQLAEFVHTAVELFASVSVWVVLGVVVSACASIWAPPAAAAAAVVPPSRSLSSAATSLAIRCGLFVLTIPVTICEHGIVSLADALRRVGGFSAGTALALIVTGPSTNAGTLLVLSRLGKKSKSSSSHNNNNNNNNNWIIFADAIRIATVVVLFGVGLSYLADEIGSTSSIAEATKSSGGGGAAALPEWLNENALSLAGVFTVASILQSSSWLLRSSSSPSACSK
eukprot:jgi/Psemu1/198993/e_gw1.228.30.1